MIEKLKGKIGEITEPRRVEKGNLRHKLEDIVIIGLCTVISGGEDYEDMETFGLKREDWLREVLKLELANGIPSFVTFERVYERLNPAELSRYLDSCIEAKQVEREVLAVDGKALRGSGALTVVSVWASETQITLGQVAVEEKSNEITGAKEVLGIVDIEGHIVTGDAMMWHKEITGQITEKGADYVLGLKGNHEKSERVFHV